MNIQSKAGRQGREDKGFTLVEILIAIVLVGILSAVAVVGISNLVSKGSTSACGATTDAAKAASAVYFASNANTYPVSFTQLVDPTKGSALTLPSAVAINTGVADSNPAATPVGMQLHSGTSWYATMTVGTATTAPTFVCS